MDQMYFECSYDIMSKPAVILSPWEKHFIFCQSTNHFLSWLFLKEVLVFYLEHCNISELSIAMQCSTSTLMLWNIWSVYTAELFLKLFLKLLFDIAAAWM